MGEMISFEYSELLVVGIGTKLPDSSEVPILINPLLITKCDGSLLMPPYVQRDARVFTTELLDAKTFDHWVEAGEATRIEPLPARADTCIYAGPGEAPIEYVTISEAHRRLKEFSDTKRDLGDFAWKRGNHSEARHFWELAASVSQHALDYTRILLDGEIHKIRRARLENWIRDQGFNPKDLLREVTASLSTSHLPTKGAVKVRKSTKLPQGFSSKAEFRKFLDSKNFLSATLVLTVIRTDKNNVIVARLKDGPYKGQWGFPGGYINIRNANETPESQARHELKKYLGIKKSALPRVYDWLDPFIIDYTESFPAVAHICVCRIGKTSKLFRKLKAHIDKHSDNCKIVKVKDIIEDTHGLDILAGYTIKITTAYILKSYEKDHKKMTEMRKRARKPQEIIEVKFQDSVKNKKPIPIEEESKQIEPGKYKIN